jgi:hypothetical protein
VVVSDGHDEWWDDLFHGAAVAAFCHQAAEEGRLPPDSEATRRRACRYYEAALAEKNRRRDSRPEPFNSRRPVEEHVS